MTKQLPPISTEQAMHRIVGLIDWPGVQAALGVGPSAARKKGDPDCTQNRLTFDEAIRLDCAYQAAGGEGAPLHEAYALRLTLAVAAATSTAAELALAAGRVAKEAGEAVNAIILAAQPGATPLDRELAKREGREGIEALTEALHKLGAGPGFALHSPGGENVNV